jgi:hypothetical protein
MAWRDGFLRTISRKKCQHLNPHLKHRLQLLHYDPLRLPRDEFRRRRTNSLSTIPQTALLLHLQLNHRLPMVQNFNTLLTIGGVRKAPRPQVANTTTGRKVPPPAPATRPTTNRTGAAKPPPPPAPPAAKQAAGAPRPNLAANLADMVSSSLESSNILVETT